MSKLKIKQEGRNSWWVQNIDDTGPEWCGPYKNREEAVEGRDGLERTRATKTWQKVQKEWLQKSSKPSSEVASPIVAEAVTTSSTGLESPAIQSQSSSTGSKSLLFGFGFGQTSKPPTPQ